MADKTTSDQLKRFFAQHGGGEEKDWKRLSKKKDAEGLWVRQFENKTSGVQIEVVENADGTFKARRLAAAANAAFAGSDGLTPALEKDPAKNAAADKIMAQLAEREDEEVPERLLKAAGRALANRFIFAVSINDPQEGLYAVVAPVNAPDWDQHLEQYIDHLMPSRNREVMEATFEFQDYPDVASVVADLQRRGFIWDREFQQNLDAHTGVSIMPQLAAFLPGSAAPAFPAPKTPQP